MFIKRNNTSFNGKPYVSVLLVQGKRVPAKRPPGRPPADAPPKTVVVHETLANLSKLPASLIDLIAGYCKKNIDPACPPTGPISTAATAVPGDFTPSVHLGPCYGVMAALHALARELGIVQAVGEATRTERLALFLIYARLAHQGSRLSAARSSEDHAVREIFEVGSFDEDDLYAALDFLDSQQERIENELHQRAKLGTLFLYDVTSVYFEGQHNELAAFGYNRDGKKGKKQLVAGLLTDAVGEPISIHLYPGNTSDPPTFLDAVTKVKTRFGGEEMTLVGDRGMIKSLGKSALGETKFRYVTALTDPQIRALLQRKVFQLDLFDEKPVEVEHADKRYVLRCNPDTQKREQARRKDQWEKLKAWIQARNESVEKSSKMKAESSLREAQRRLKQYRLVRWISLQLEGRKVVWIEDAQAGQIEAELDGCYVVETDLPKPAATAQEVHDRYLDLTQVERDFRTIKTGLLEIRPVFLRKASRTRGHAVVGLLALKLARELDRRVAPLGLTVADALSRLEGVRLVSLGDPEGQLWRLADSYPKAQTEVLEKLPKLPAPMLSLGKANRNRLKNPRRGRD